MTTTDGHEGPHESDVEQEGQDQILYEQEIAMTVKITFLRKVYRNPGDDPDLIASTYYIEQVQQVEVKDGDTATDWRRVDTVADSMRASGVPVRSMEREYNNMWIIRVMSDIPDFSPSINIVREEG